MKLTVLGCYGPYPKAGGSCSGYLLESEETKILIDCGNGVLSKLLNYCNDLNKLDAIFISHMHPDHMSDLMVMRYAINIKQMFGKLKQPIPIYLPASPQEEYDRIQYQGAFVRNIIHEGTEISINNMKVTFKKTDHPLECYAMAFEKDNKKFVYSGDTKYFDGFIDFVKGSNLLLCEANILHKYMNENVPHLSGRQVGEIAVKADLQRVILTHFLPEISVAELLEETKEVFPHMLQIAEEGKCYFI
ncbi:beta-lactamase domain-containing protein [Clostridium aceticum]|uniref:Beta-lactamase domain-containing protein n=1 Tax=Clostridium aceticum TaxID=84022 RepID=A0A0D8I599_9CLOT|nr:MBL fold metallo-hydrolase [Clostridium aceticum]AKL95839.1 beta-lactamase domain-containing protein [Clostridium aceticum]KJF25455.1 beta-lactamase [Clostridium aceticum]